METTASQIANYRGNAATALGSTDGGVGGGAAIIWGDTDADRVNSRLDVISAANMQKNKDLYELKLKQRDELFDKIASKQMDTGQMLPGDRDLVREKYLQPMRDMLIANPDLKSDPDQYIKFQALTSDFEEAKTYGQSRFLQMGILDGEISKELDPEKKRRMVAHREAMNKQDLFKEVKPYQQTLDWDQATFATSAPVVSTSEDMDAATNKIMTTTRSHTPLEGFIKGTLHNYVDSQNATMKNKMDAFADSFLQLPDDVKAETIKQWNAKIAEANADEGLKPGDLNYVKPIAFNFIKDADGVEHLGVLETAPRIVLAESILQGYKSTTSVAGKVDKLPSEIAKNLQAAAKDAAEIKYKIPAEAAVAYANARKIKADTAKTNQETKDLQSKANKEEANGNYYINQTLNMIDPKRYTDLPDVKDAPQFKDSKLSGKVLMGLDESGETRSALSPEELRALGLPTNTTTGIGIETPVSVIYNTDDPKNPFFIAIFDPAQEAVGEIDPITKLPVTGIARPGTKIDNAAQRVAIVPAGRVLERMVKGVVGENTAGKESDDYKITMSQLKKRSGKENINGGLISLIDKPDYQMDAKPETKTPAKKTVPKKKVPAPPEVKQKIDSLFNASK